MYRHLAAADAPRRVKVVAGGGAKPHNLRMRIGAILQGGRSRRMGRDKALVVVDGAPMRDHVAAALAATCDRVVQLGGPGADVTDLVAGDGPFGAIVALVESGLAGEDGVYVVAPVDMPRLSGRVLQRLIDACADAEAAAFAGHPLPVVVRATARDRLRAAYDAGERRVKAIATAVVDVDADDAGALVNVNSDDELARLR